MSFMFNPYPYDDPKAVNRIQFDAKLSSTIKTDSIASAKQIATDVLNIVRDRKNCIIGIEGYLTAPMQQLAELVSLQLVPSGIPVTIISTENLLLSSDVLHEKFLPFLPEDRTNDPVLLYGSLYEEDYESIMDLDEIDALEANLKEFAANGTGVLILQGYGALIDRLRNLCNTKIYIDMTQKRTILNLRSGKGKNLGSDEQIPINQVIRRSYYIDFEIMMRLRGKLLKNDLVDYYVTGDDSDKMQLVDVSTLKSLFTEMTSYPLRCRPVYIEGIWGGFYIKRLRNLPEEMKNCAWVFDLIPMEVSIVADIGSTQLEFPFYFFVQLIGEKLMGQKAHQKFGGYFPIRFNYDDTYHASGNMSIQVHPDGEFIRMNNEKGRQDESYYMVVTGQEAKTYCGFREDADVEDFIAKAKIAETEGIGFNHDDFVYSHPSVAGQQFLIPAGTIHASGRNQVILEIGSLTMGSYTYKMYDYMRKDLEGNLRPIHSAYGEQVLCRDRREEWVKKNLIQQPRSVRKGDSFEESIVGEHDLLYFSLRHIRFTQSYNDITTDRFHVLVLVEGEHCTIRSLKDHTRFYEQDYLEMVIIPADFGDYEVINRGVGTVTMHKTLLKDGFENE